MRAMGLVCLALCLVLGCGGEGESGTSGDDATSGGDAGATPDGEGDVVDAVCTAVVGCHGEAVCAEQIGDGICNWSLVCDTHTLDGGDCCEGEEAIEGCDDGYYFCPQWLNAEETTWILDTLVGDGRCDSGYDCERLEYDGGDCSCPEGETMSWCPILNDNWEEESPDYQTCKPTSELGDGVCNPWFDCRAHDYDGKDCDYDHIPYEDDWCTAVDMATVCEMWSSYCVTHEYVEAHVGDGVCNRELSCDQYDWDGGDCAGTEWEEPNRIFGYTVDCQGNPVPEVYALHLKINAVCDLEMRCHQHSFDWEGCDSACPEGEGFACDGTCVSDPTARFGDGHCDEELVCYEDEEYVDCSETELCPEEGMVEDCYGWCMPSDAITDLKGDGVCNPPLHCEEYEYDDGDCWEAPWCDAFVEVADWNDPTDGLVTCGIGTGGDFCEPDWFLGDGFCDGFFYCEQYDYEMGDCEPCDDPGKIKDCNAVCVDAAYLGDGVCDGNLACNSSDGGDCSCGDDGTDPTDTDVRNCAGACVNEATLHDAEWDAYANDVCDEAFRCHLGTWDMGGCGTGEHYTGCEILGQIPNCDGVCGDRTAIGDGTCDEAFNCWSFGYDARDCPQP